VSIDEGAAAAGEPQPKKKGRFKIIEEENPSSRAPSKVPSSANLAAGAGGGSGRGMGAAAAAVLPELVRLHEQSVSHAHALARVIDSMRAGCSYGNLAAAAGEDLSAAAAAGALPPRKPAAAGSGGSSSGVLSRVGSSRLLMGGGDLKVVSLQQLLQDSNGDSMDVAEKLYERVQVGLAGTVVLACSSTAGWRLSAGSNRHSGVTAGQALCMYASAQCQRASSCMFPHHPLSLPAVLPLHSLKPLINSLSKTLCLNLFAAAGPGAPGCWAGGRAQPVPLTPAAGPSYGWQQHHHECSTQRCA
jgi:hypothetical protein